MTHELNTGGDRGYLRIATEEAFATREQIDAICGWCRTARADKGMVEPVGLLRHSAVRARDASCERLLDLGELRLAGMDETGIDKAILALTAPGVQPLLDVDEAKRIAARRQRPLGEALQRHPTASTG